MIVFVWFCMRFIWPPIITAIEERQTRDRRRPRCRRESGRQSLDKAKSEEADGIIEEARKQATSILDQANARANEIVAEGKAEGVKERERQLAAGDRRGRAGNQPCTRRAAQPGIRYCRCQCREDLEARNRSASAHEDILSELAGRALEDADRKWLTTAQSPGPMRALLLQ